MVPWIGVASITPTPIPVKTRRPARTRLPTFTLVSR